MDLAICWTVRCQSCKTIQRMSSTCSSEVDFFFFGRTLSTPEPVLNFGPECGSAKGTMADLGPLGSKFRLGYLRVGELQFCLLCNIRTALDLASSLSRKLAYVPGPTSGFVKLLASSGSHCTKWTDEQHRPAGFESRLIPDLPLPFIPTLIGLRAFDLVSNRVWWEAATNKTNKTLLCCPCLSWIPLPSSSPLHRKVSPQIFYHIYRPLRIWHKVNF